MEKIYFNSLLLFSFFSCLSVCNENIPEIWNYLIIFSFLLISILRFFVERKIIKDFFFKILIFGFFVPLFLSIIVSFFNINLLSENRDYINYFFKDSLGRKINILVFFLIFIGINSTIKNGNKYILKKILKSYILGVTIFISIVGLWQVLNKYFNIPMLFELNSRAHIHSAGTVANFLKIRLTGLANEPSYAAPYLIDVIILSYLFRYRKLLVFNLLVLLLTYSGGGYINLFFLFVLIFFHKGLARRKTKIFIIILSIFFSLLLVSLNFYKFLELFSPVLNRFSSEHDLFSIKYNIRSYMVIMPFVWIFLEEGFFPYLFGMGTGSFKYLSNTKFFYDGRSVHGTSNNLFSDFVYECGYIGLVLVIIMFFLLFKRLERNFKKNKNIYNKVNLILFFHLIVSSLYRADFLSSRFFLIISFIKILDLLGKKRKINDKKKVKNNEAKI